MAKRIGPEAKIIALFTALPEDSKRIVFDVLKSQTATPRKASTKKPRYKVVEPKDAPLLPDNPDDFQQGSVSL